MRRIAITGNIACGKSLVEKILVDKGYKVLNTDDLAHSLLDKNVEDEFCGYDIFESGKISRNKLGKLVFGDKNLLLKLEKIIHPKIRLEIERFFHQNQQEKYLFVAIPQLFEANMQDLFDDIVLIYASDEIRLKRLMQRDGYELEYAKQRMNAQISQDEKIKKSTYVIKNEKTIDDLKNAINKLY